MTTAEPRRSEAVLLDEASCDGFSFDISKKSAAPLSGCLSYIISQWASVKTHFRKHVCSLTCCVRTLRAAVAGRRFRSSETLVRYFLQELMSASNQLGVETRRSTSRMFPSMDVNILLILREDSRVDVSVCSSLLHLHLKFLRQTRGHLESVPRCCGQDGFKAGRPTAAAMRVNTN